MRTATNIPQILRIAVEMEAGALHADLVAITADRLRLRLSP